MAQLVARFHGMEEVRGSNPLSSTPDERPERFTTLSESVRAFVVPRAPG